MSKDNPTKKEIRAMITLVKAGTLKIEVTPLPDSKPEAAKELG